MKDWMNFLPKEYDKQKSLRIKNCTMRKISLTFYVLQITVCFLLFISLNQNIVAQNKSDVQTGYAPVNGLKMYYEIHGTGKPLVMIHGSFMTINLGFGSIIPELA